MKPRGLALLGCGGHARSAADIALACGIAEIVFVDPAARLGERLLGFPVVATLDPLPPDWAWLPALGDNAARDAQLRAMRSPPYTLIAPDAHVSEHALLGVGVLVGHGCHVGPLAAVGDGTIVNNGAIIEHDGRVGRCCHVSVQATLAGRVTLGERVFVGAGAVVIDGVAVADDVVVGAGATVVCDLRDPGTYVGTPARRLSA